VKKELSQVGTLIRERSNKLDFKRVYIPKTDGNWRPLGVPSPSWRVYLHMYNAILSLFLRPYLSPHQHAYIKGRGVLTAWADVVERLASKDIYEFDLKGFFPSVNTQFLSLVLRLECNMPRLEIDWLEGLFKCFPVLPVDQKTSEDSAIFKRRYQEIVDEFATADPQISGHGPIHNWIQGLLEQEFDRANEGQVKDYSNLDYGGFDPSEWKGLEYMLPEKTSPYRTAKEEADRKLDMLIDRNDESS
jgi:hypothetical protein